jgi:hypothetical protein
MIRSPSYGKKCKENDFKSIIHLIISDFNNNIEINVKSYALMICL